MFYKIPVAGWWSLKLDVQYIADPGGTDDDDAVVVGFRTEIRF